MGIIRPNLRIGKLNVSTLCHVIDARISYNLLLGRPWIHENRVIPSSWHQCFMYEKYGVVEKVVADESPFTEAESYFADAKFYAKRQDVVGDVDKSSVDTPLEPKWKRKQVVELDQHDKELVLPVIRTEPLRANAPEALSCSKRNPSFPTQHTEGIDPNGYKLLAKAGNDLKEPQRLGKLIPEAGGKGFSRQQDPQSHK